MTVKTTFSKLSVCLAASAICLTLSSTHPQFVSEVQAAGCPASVQVNNNTGKIVQIVVSSKTRLNPRWREQKVVSVAAHKKKVSYRFNYDLVGCSVKRAVKVEYSCYHGTGQGVFWSDQDYHEMQKPIQKLIVTPKCG